ncbi:MAG TPA: NAD(P)-dependent oxidoreductase [Microvirga sp.]|jgi:2-hydroxy-3-oxopropionate reductase
MPQLRIALLGTGLMGAPMVRRLLGAGFSVTVWNRTPEKAQALAADGAEVAGSAAEAAREADAVITMLENGAVVTDVLFGQGVAAAMRAGATFIDMSSIPPSVAKDHAARLAERGVRHLDAPVSGGTVGAEQGTLAIMAGGEKAVFEAALPVFAAMGRSTHVGPHGAGQLAKLANQAIVGITIGAVSEALLLAAAGGADPAAVREAIRGGFAESRILEVHGQRMIDRDFAPRGFVHIQVKDLDTILATAAEYGLTLPLTQNVRDRFVELRDRLGGSHLDHSALLLQLEAMNPPHTVAKVGEG